MGLKCCGWPAFWPSCARHPSVLLRSMMRSWLSVEQIDLESTVEALQAAMAEASRIVLGGFTLRSEVKTISYPDRFEDPRGANMWKHDLGSDRGQ